MAQKIKVIINKRVAKGITREVARTGIDYAALQAENELIDILSVPPRRSGILYKQGNNRSSAPGEAPAPISGKLRQSVKSYPEEFGDTFSAVVGTALNYGAHLELGTERIRPRPWISLLNEEKRWSRILKAFRVGVRRQYARARGSLNS
ncbi:MAG: hypothetical protein IPK75_12785 [Acidobacteria bacterium]|nr:hypothetical protein [Acidobacteriota bacterium]